MLAIPASANAAQVQAFGPNVNVFDNAPEDQHADNIVFTKVDPWIVQLRNEAGDAGEPLFLSEESSDNVDCIQDNPRQVTCVRLDLSPLAFDLNGGYGNDTITVSEHNPGDSVAVRGHWGNDVLNIQNGSVERYSCGGNDPESGSGSDTVVRDATDTLFNPALPTDCENDNNPGGSGGGGGGAGGGGAGGGSGDPGTPPVGTPITQPANLILGPVISPHRKILVAARVNGPGRVLGIATSKNRKLLARGEKTATKAGAVTVVLKPTKLGKRLLKHKRSIKVKLSLSFYPKSGAPTVTKTTSAKLRR
jgi:hypothetical protein